MDKNRGSLVDNDIKIQNQAYDYDSAILQKDSTT